MPSPTRRSALRAVSADLDDVDAQLMSYLVGPRAALNPQPNRTDQDHWAHMMLRAATARTVRVLAVLALTLLATLGLAGTASAHATLIGSDPADGADVQTAPTDVTLTFDDSLENFEPVVTVTGPDGNQYQTGTTTIDGVHAEQRGAAAAGRREPTRSPTAWCPTTGTRSRVRCVSTSRSPAVARTRPALRPRRRRVPVPGRISLGQFGNGAAAAR